MGGGGRLLTLTRVLSRARWVGGWWAGMEWEWSVEKCKCVRASVCECESEGVSECVNVRA